MKFPLRLLLASAGLVAAVPYVASDPETGVYAADTNVNNVPVAEDDCTTANAIPQQTMAAAPNYEGNAAYQDKPDYGGQAAPQEPVVDYGAAGDDTVDSDNAGGAAYVDNDEDTGSGGSYDDRTPVKLLPATHWSQDTSHLGTISPSEAGNPTSLYYSEDGVAEPTKSFYWSVLHLFFTSPAVVLDHTDHIQSVTWDGAQQQLTILFDSQDAFNHAQQLWTNELTIVTDSPGCGGFHGDDRCYIKVSALAFQSDGRTLIVSGTPTPLDACITGGESEWGVYKPHGGYAGTGPSKNNATNGGGIPPSTNETDPFGIRNATCTGPTDTKYNLPSACLGPFFDDDLDDQLGYGGLSTEDHELLDGALSNVETPQRRSILKKRGPFSFFASPVPSVTNVISNVGKIAQRGAEVITTGSITSDLHDTFPFKIPNGTPFEDPSVKQVVSPWGDSVLLSAFGSTNNFVNVFCVGCGAQGQIEVGGKVTFGATSGITAGTLDILADVKAVLKLGIDAQSTLRDIKFKKVIFKIPLSPLLFGPISVGPLLTIGGRIALDVFSKGRLLSGGEFTWVKARAVIDIVDPSNSRRENYDPVFKATSQIDGPVFEGGELGLPLGYGFGISVFGITKNTGVVNEPIVKRIAKSAETANIRESSELTAGFNPLPGCTGTSISLSWRNVLYTQILNVKGVDLLDTGYKVISEYCSRRTTKKRDALGDESTLQARQAGDDLIPDNSTLPDGVEDVSGQANGSTVATYELVDVASLPYNRTDGVEFTMLVEQSGNNHAIFCDNGNIYVKGASDALQLGCEDLWAFVDHNVFSDGEGRFLHYYKNTMDLLGVSRLRLTDAVTVTNHTEAVVLLPFSAEGAHVPADPVTEGLYFATDDEENVLWLTLCMYSDGQAPKAFVVKDPDQGAQLLSSPDLKYTVTGGTVSTCLPLALKQGDERAGSR